MPDDAASSDDAGTPAAITRPERPLALTDAVVAIAMTLLALDLKPTGIADSASSGQLAHYLHVHVSQYATFAIAFALIAQYWYTHHRLMRTVRHVSGRLMGETLVFLFGITLIPLSEYLSGTFGNPLAVTIFAANMFLVGVALALAGETIHRERLDERVEQAPERVARRVRGVVALFIPVLVAALAWVIGPQAAWLYLLFIAVDYPGSWAARRVSRSA